MIRPLLSLLTVALLVDVVPRCAFADDAPANAAPAEAAVLPREQALGAHPTGFLLVVEKSQRRLYLARDGAWVTTVTVLKSTLDRKFFGFLEGTADDQVTFTFPVPAAVSDRLGTRTWKWDRKTPEGEYRICNHSDRGHTNHTVALCVDYPRYGDLENALKKGRITKDQYKQQKRRLDAGLCPSPDTYLGGWIRIHGPSDADVIAWRTKGVRQCPSDPPDPAACTQLTYEEYLRKDSPTIGVVVPGRYSKGCIVLELTSLFYLYQTVPDNTPIVILP